MANKFTKKKKLLITTLVIGFLISIFFALELYSLKCSIGFSKYCYRGYFAGHWDKYKPLISDLPNKRCLEIGSYKGESALYIIENYCNGEDSYLDAVDTWEGSMEYYKNGPVTGLYKEFHTRLEKYIDTNKVRPYTGESANILLDFIQEVREHKREKYDFIYIDASHAAKDVLMDAVLAWEILNVGGLMFFDDYEWKIYNDTWLCPKAAIDGFLNSYKSMYEVLGHGFQVYLKKIADRPVASN